MNACKAALLAVVLAYSSLLYAQDDHYLGVETIRLWDDRAPGAVGDTDADIPALTKLDPAFPQTNHPAVIVAPGGSYKRLMSVHEGRQVADWFTERGFTAFVLKYRLGPRYLYPVPFQDAQRAIRVVRARAKELDIDPNRIVMIGFSAGGHLTAMAATASDEENPSAPDPIDRVSSRVNYMVLGYPWLNAMEPKRQSWISYCSELSIAAAQCGQFEQYSPVKRVTPQTPPAFLFHTADDDIVPVETSVQFFQALHASGVRAELHIYEKGPHGVGFGTDGPGLDTWSVLLDNWLRTQGLLHD